MHVFWFKQLKCWLTLVILNGWNLFKYMELSFSMESCWKWRKRSYLRLSKLVYIKIWVVRVCRHIHIYACMSACTCVRLEKNLEHIRNFLAVEVVGHFSYNFYWNLFLGAKVWKLAARCIFWQTAEDWLIRNQAWFQVKQAEAAKSS